MTARRSAPRLVGDGPATASTCLDLVPRVVWIADVNGYYRDLGVDPRASRGEIARAYFERGRDDAHLTYVVKQLLDPAVRRAYDATPLGEIFVDDEVIARLKRRFVGVVSEGGGTFDPGSEPAPWNVVDRLPWSGQDAVNAISAWPFSYYLWDLDEADLDRLRHWQEALVVALGRAGVRRQIAVGMTGGVRPEVEVLTVGSRTVVFFHQQSRSTDALVQRAVSRFLPDAPSAQRDTSMSQPIKPSFRKGADEAREASKGGGSFARSHFFALDGDPKSKDNTAILRFLTEFQGDEAWIVVQQHQNVPTRPKPSDYPKDARWPEKMSAVCRKDVAFDGMYSDCFICDNIVGTNNVRKASARVWALACLREEVVENGQVVGYRDATREIAVTNDKGEATGETRTEKAIVIVNMGFKNFFSILEGFGGHYKTVLDRDYFIKRVGTDTDTQYQIVPLDPIVDADGKVFDVRRPEIAERYGEAGSYAALEAIVVERAADEFYARFFDTRVAQPATQGGTKSEGGEAAEEAAKPGHDVVSEDRLARLASRVKDYGQPGQGEPSGDTPAASVGGGMRDFG